MSTTRTITPELIGITVGKSRAIAFPPLRQGRRRLDSPPQASENVGRTAKEESLAPPSSNFWHCPRTSASEWRVCGGGGSSRILADHSRLIGIVIISPCIAADRYGGDGVGVNPTGGIACPRRISEAISALCSRCQDAIDQARRSRSRGRGGRVAGTKRRHINAVPRTERGRVGDLRSVQCA